MSSDLKNLFDTYRKMLGGKLTQDQVDAINNIIDEFGLSMFKTIIGVKDVERIAFTKDGFDILKKEMFKSMNQIQVDNINLIFEAVNKHEVSNVQQVAYLLATVYHETNATMLPVREAYWLSEAWRKKNLRYYPWYGRGYVQITWLENYQKMDDELGLDGALVQNLDLALDPKIASEILVIGSKKGMFTTKSLDDYINASGCDYKGARCIINGTDKASQIAKYAQIFEKALKA